MSHISHRLDVKSLKIPLRSLPFALREEYSYNLQEPSRMIYATYLPPPIHKILRKKYIYYPICFASRGGDPLNLQDDNCNP
ncbi:hypothetical protein GIB67_035804 [Kingdonia uniflora]|uniref:Uncharacterized protein n=1 Tax=Kingdonia uniflora TaxID=39325 RepID=A0A7J7MJM0_9MAGN|nr:hypothetical protein GIB67_035804 [Kingdonia uniflora]